MSFWYHSGPIYHQEKNLVAVRRYNPLFWAKKGKKGPKIPNMISPEPLAVEGWLTPQNDQKSQLSISV